MEGKITLTVLAGLLRDVWVDKKGGVILDPA
jgi:hypothetical protein